jgi:hypothetical protein
MPYQLIIREEAHLDANEAYNYYEEKSTGLGERFLQELIQRYNEITAHPEYYGFIDEQKIIRDVKLRHFPYLIVYEFKGDKVIVYSVLMDIKILIKKSPNKLPPGYFKNLKQKSRA